MYRNTTPNTPRTENNPKDSPGNRQGELEKKHELPSINGDACSPGKTMIEIRNLSKDFKDQKAVNSISLSIKEGDAFGFIGPNGAGKTTTIRILATLLDPTEGDAYIDGASVLNEPDYIRKIIGFMPDYFGVYDGMKTHEYLDFFAAAYLIPSSARPKLIDDVLEITDLTGKRDAFIETLSKGMRQRLGIAKTLLHDPKVLILDEPASGLDPRARIELKELIKELKRMKKTVFISSHILPELADICNTIGILEAGSLLACGSVRDFQDNLNAAEVRTVRIRTLDNQEEAARFIQNYKGIVDFEETSGVFVAKFTGSVEDLSVLLSSLIEQKFKVIEFFEKTADLEDIFLRITKGVVK